MTAIENRDMERPKARPRRLVAASLALAISEVDCDRAADDGSVVVDDTPVG